MKSSCFERFVFWSNQTQKDCRFKQMKIAQITTECHKTNKQKPFNALCLQVAIAESFGGNDEPVDKLTQDLVGLGIDPVLTLRVRADPTEQVRSCCPCSATARSCGFLLLRVSAAARRCEFYLAHGR